MTDLNRNEAKKIFLTKTIFSVFCSKLSLRQTAWRSYGLSKMDALCINWYYSLKDQFVKFWRKLLSFWWWLKNSVFLSRPFWKFFCQKKIFFLLHSYLNQSQFKWSQGWDEILMITLISSKKIGVYKIMRNTVINHLVIQHVVQNLCTKLICY